jgi:enamine deaminase RidA (YjgF/YER057c/UK114 family)
MPGPDDGVRFVNPPDLPPPMGYTHVVEATVGRTIFVSGQVALDASGRVVGVGDMEAQARQVFENLASALRAVGATFADVVKLTYYVLDMGKIGAVRAARDGYVDADRPPASSAVQVSRLIRDELLLEIDAIAVVPA